MIDCVATTPTPASPHVTTDPTENQCDWTATPISPVFESRATIENVCTTGPAAADVATSSPQATHNPSRSERMPASLCSKSLHAGRAFPCVTLPAQRDVRVFGDKPDRSFTEDPVSLPHRLLSA